MCQPGGNNKCPTNTNRETQIFTGGVFAEKCLSSTASRKKSCNIFKVSLCFQLKILKSDVLICTGNTKSEKFPKQNQPQRKWGCSFKQSTRRDGGGQDSTQQHAADKQSK